MSVPLTTKGDWALACAAAALFLEPCLPNTKGRKRRAVDWNGGPTVDPVKIRAHWMRFPDDNIRIETKPPAPGVPLVVVDVDVHGDKDGRPAIAELERRHGPLPKTLTVNTPNGGVHYYFSAPCPVVGGTDKLGRGVDVQSNGRIVIGPGSTIDGKAYTTSEFVPVAPAPAWLIELLPTAHTRAQPSAAAPTDTTDDARQRSIRYLRVDATPAVEGSGGDQRTFSTAARLKDFGCSEADAFNLMLSYYNPRCSPPWSPDDLRKKVANAYRYGSEPAGAANPAKDFAPVVSQSDGPDWLAEMNKRYAFVRADATVHERVFDHELGCERNAWISTEVLAKRHRSQKVKVVDPNKNGKVVWTGMGSAWLDHPQLRSYDTAAFLPGADAPSGVLNLWHGWAVEPRRGSWARIQHHIEQVICAGDPVRYGYVIRWLARMYQQPGEPGLVALVLMSAEGAGKGVFFRMIERTLGEHAVALSQNKHLVGHFNQHLYGKIAVYADEAFYAGDVAHRAALFANITEPRIQIEPKGVDARQARNVMHLIMATNSAWAVPASAEARRFCVLPVSDTYASGSDARRRTAYFDALIAEINGAGPAAMLHDLLGWDLSGFDVTKVPATEALRDQKIQSLSGVDKWLHDCLENCRIGAHEWSEEPLSVLSADAYADYRRFSRDAKEYRQSPQSLWAKQVRKVLAGARAVRPWTRAGDRPRMLELPPLSVCRQAFARYLNCELDWELDAAPAPMLRAANDPHGIFD